MPKELSGQWDRAIIAAGPARFRLFCSVSATEAHEVIKAEIQRLRLPAQQHNTDVLAWWRAHEPQAEFPHRTVLARRFPCSQVFSE